MSCPLGREEEMRCDDCPVGSECYCDGEGYVCRSCRGLCPEGNDFVDAVLALNELGRLVDGRQKLVKTGA